MTTTPSSLCTGSDLIVTFLTLALSVISPVDAIADPPRDQTHLHTFKTPSDSKVASAAGGGAYDNQTTHKALTYAALLNQRCAVHDYLVEELLLDGGIERIVFFDGQWRSLDQWAAYGSDLEDVPVWRVLNHFMDPITDRPLHIGTDLGAGADEWAFSYPGNEWDLDSTSVDCFEMLTASSPQLRDSRSAETFKGLGHFMHLIQDMAVPEHTRNDQHLVASTRHIENYAKNNYGTLPQLDNLAKVVLNPFATSPPYLELQEPLPIHIAYRRFFDTGQYTGQPGFAGFTSAPGLAEYANYNFFSRDTVFGLTDYPHPSYGDTNFFPNFPVTNFALNHTDQVSSPFVYVRKTNQPSVGVEGNFRLCAARNLGFSQIWDYYFHNAKTRIEIGINDALVLEDYCQLLLPKAIAYCTDFANFYFRGRFEVSLVGNSESGKLELTITNRSGAALTTGYFMLLQDDAEGIRTEIPVDWSDNPLTFPDGDSFAVEFSPTGKTGQYTLVFRALGAENDPFTIEIVAKAFKQKSGACCLVGGGCEVLFVAECDARAGAFQGPDTLCEDTCTGACCYLDQCSIMTETACTASQGTFLGAQTTCDSPCPVGACCLDGDCQTLTQSSCAALGGTFQGVDSTCENACPGACCLSTGCQVISQANCISQGGGFMGYGASCEDTCPGACCYSNGCASVSQTECTQLQGSFQGVGTNCDSSCQEGQGACCLDGGCEILTEDECLAQGGMFRGEHSTCGECLVPCDCTNCPPILTATVGGIQCDRIPPSGGIEDCAYHDGNPVCEGSVIVPLSKISTSPCKYYGEIVPPPPYGCVEEIGCTGGCGYDVYVSVMCDPSGAIPRWTAGVAANAHCIVDAQPKVCPSELFCGSCDCNGIIVIYELETDSECPSGSFSRAYVDDPGCWTNGSFGF